MNVTKMGECLLMNIPLLQAHRGVSSDYPENTMSAFIGAAYQHYGVIELDPYYTLDDKIVVIHDEKLNRTARYPDGSKLERDINIKDITYRQALKYDFGQFVSKKYKGEHIPLLSEVLEFAAKSDILIKIDNRYERFPQKQKSLLYSVVRESCARVALTVTSVEAAQEAMREIPDCDIHYDGRFSEETIIAFSKIVPREKLVIWLPFENNDTAWLKSGFADKQMCDTVNKYARLGLWLLSTYDEYRKAAEWGAYIVETNGKLKPRLTANYIPDTHVHSCHSHDSTASLSNIRESAEKKGILSLCVTDHCDVEFYKTIDLCSNASNAIKEIDKETGNGATRLLKGIEIGESSWNTEITEEILQKNQFDQVIDSVHAVKYPSYTMPYSQIDFGRFTNEQVRDYVKAYFYDVKRMIELTQADVLAHLTCPLRYINGKYGHSLDCRIFENEIRDILQTVIQKKIALEVNTSCLGSNYNELMPETWILRMYKDMGGHLVTLGSDAHLSENIGKGFDQAKIILKELGFNYLCSFVNRFIVQCKI